MAKDVAPRLRALLFAGIAIGALIGGPAGAQVATDYYYDALGRLIAAVDSNGKTVGYAYDAAGNRTRVSNNVPMDEILPAAFTASNAITGTGLSTPNGMRDGAFVLTNTIHATAATANSWITADFGSAKRVDHVDVAPTSASPYGVANLNGVTLQWSLDNAAWTTIGQVSGAALNSYLSIPVGGVTARYFRLFQPAATQIAIGDFRFYSSSTTGNRPPEADSFAVNLPAAGGAIDLTTHIRDPDNNPLSVTVNQPTAAQHGTPVPVSGAPTINYTPNTNYSGPDSFSYTVSDGRNGFATGLISVTVAAPINNPPVAVSEPIGTPPNVAATITPLSNDSDPDGDSFYISNAVVNGGGPAHGTVTFTTSTITYTPTFGWTGTSDSVTYTITDSRGLSASAIDPVTVAYGAGPNHPPTANHDVTTITKNTTLTNFNLVSNDTDVDGDVLTIESVVNGPNGTATINSPASTINFVPQTNFVGTATFNYSVTDGRGGHSTAVVDVVVQEPTNQAPVANDDYVSVTGHDFLNIYVLGNDSDPEGQAITISGKTNASNGTTGFDSGKVWYQAFTGFVGTDTFTYTIKDIYGAQATATVHITVGNTPPYQNPVTVNTAYNTAITFDPRSGPTDIDGQAVSVQSVTQPSGGAGTAQVLSASSVRFTPTAGFSGATTFDFTVADTAGGQFTSTITVNVSPASGLAIVPNSTTWDGGRFLNGPTSGSPSTLSVSVSGGTAPYTYSWVRTGGDANTTATSPSGSATSFYWTGIAVGPHISTWKCVVTDSLGVSGETGPLTVTYSYENGS